MRYQCYCCCCSSIDSGVSMRSRRSKATPVSFKTEREIPTESWRRPTFQHSKHPPTTPDQIFACLEDNIHHFVRELLKKLKKLLNRRCSEEQQEMEEVMEAFLKIGVHILRTMGQKELADALQRKTSFLSQNKFKSSLKKRSKCVFEGIPNAGSPAPLEVIYTDVYITEGGSGEVNHQHEVRQIPRVSSKADRAETTLTCSNIFRASPGRETPIRTVMTRGVAGVGKTVLTQKFTLDWAEDKTNRDVHFMFPFTFRELNVLRGKKYSLVELVHQFFPEAKKAEICSFEDSEVVFIFDGLDECRLPLDFHKTEILTDVMKSTSVDVLLTNLIRGELLPSAHVWITSRPAAANQIPPQCVDLMTEVRGFTDAQKEEYFRKRFSDDRQFSRIMSHIQTSQSLHIMCHIPVFCWITATVLEDVLNKGKGGELPTTLTEMYIHFLVVQTKIKKAKYDGGSETDSHWSPESIELIESLGKLAFEHLQKKTLTFNDADLRESGIDIRAASVNSGVFTQIFREERGLYRDKVFCFVHLSVQEFLAALHVHRTFINSGVNLLEKQTTTSQEDEAGEHDSAEARFYQIAVEKALQNPTGSLDLFLRFLLGLSLPTNQRLLTGLLVERESSEQTRQTTIQYIKKKLNEKLPSERSINLFHCLNELNDHSFKEKIQWCLNSGCLFTEELSPAQWSALVFLLLSSEKHLDVFDLKKYSASEEALLKLLPVLKASKKALLSGCNLSDRSCEALSSVLSSQSCTLRSLDLSNNDLQDSGVELLSGALQSPHCKLQTLRLSGCQITEDGCASLVSALNTKPSGLRELDLSYNHSGKKGVKLFSAVHHRLDSLRLFPSGSKWLRPHLKKYACKVRLDPNTVHRYLLLYHDSKALAALEEPQELPYHPERYYVWPQARGLNALSGRCYWEVEWERNALIAVTYKPETDDEDGCLGQNAHSWCLCCSSGLYHAWHNKSRATIRPPPNSSPSNRVGVYLDWHAGTLSFYRLSSDIPIHLHTFHSTFTDTVYPAFGFLEGPGSSLSLCELDD